MHYQAGVEEIREDYVESSTTEPSPNLEAGSSKLSGKNFLTLEGFKIKVYTFKVCYLDMFCYLFICRTFIGEACGKISMWNTKHLK